MDVGPTAQSDARPNPRILVLAESLPFPTLKGGDLRTWQNVNALATIGRIGVFGLCSNDVRRDANPDVALDFWTTSTDPALASPPPKGVRLAGRAWLLDPNGHPSDLYFSVAAEREVARLLERFRPDIVLLEGLWLHGYLHVIREAGCNAILDCHNVEAAVFRELAASTEGAGLEARVVRELLPARTEAIERNAVGSVDQLWVCSIDDEDRLRDMYRPAASIVVVPNGIRVDHYDPASRVDAHVSGTPLTVVFPGFFPYIPNAVAATFLIEQILPRLVAAGGACRLVLVGAMPSPELIAAAARDPHILVTGAVRDVRPYLADATVMAVPLFQGGGTRLKVLEGFAAGLPVISTAKGAEGLDVQDRTHLLIAETADEFVDAILVVARDRELSDRLTANARRIVAERYSWDTIGSHIRNAVAAVTRLRRSTPQ